MTAGRSRDEPAPAPALSPQALARFDAQVLPHLDAAYNLARHLLRDAQDAEDMVQESFLKAVRFFDGFRGGDGRTWLLAIVRNTCFTQLRRRRSAGEKIEFDEELHSEVDAAADPAAELERAAAAATLDEAMSRLPVEFREVLVLRELEELSYKEIAHVAGVPIGTVMSRLARARQRLSIALGAAPKGDD